MMNIQVLLMVSGDPGVPGRSVPRAVVEERRPGGDSVTIQPRHMGGETVRGSTLCRASATLKPVPLYQVTTYRFTDLYIQDT